MLLQYCSAGNHIFTYAHNVTLAETGKTSQDVGDGMTAATAFGLACLLGTYGGTPHLRQILYP